MRTGPLLPTGLMIDEWDRVRTVILDHAIQTNEAARCATLLLFLAAIEGPVSWWLRPRYRRSARHSDLAPRSPLRSILRREVEAAVWNHPFGEPSPVGIGRRRRLLPIWNEICRFPGELGLAVLRIDP